MTDDERTLIRRQRMGFIFQSFNLLPAFTAEENVALPLELGGMSSSVARRRAAETLDMVGVGHRRSHIPCTMSGGEQQRVAIARALVTQPALLLADEPPGNLDSTNGQQVVALLRKLVDDDQQTIVDGHPMIRVWPPRPIAWSVCGTARSRSTGHGSSSTLSLCEPASLRGSPDGALEVHRPGSQEPSGTGDLDPGEHRDWRGRRGGCVSRHHYHTPGVQGDVRKPQWSCRLGSGGRGRRVLRRGPSSQLGRHLGRQGPPCRCSNTVRNCTTTVAAPAWS